MTALSGVNGKSMFGLFLHRLLPWILNMLDWKLTYIPIIHISHSCEFRFREYQ